MESLVKNAREALLLRRSRLTLLSEGERRELHDIEDALARIQAGDFGRCSQCGGALGHYRMRAIPEARYCLTCSERVGR